MRYPAFKLREPPIGYPPICMSPATSLIWGEIPVARDLDAPAPAQHGHWIMSGLPGAGDLGDSARAIDIARCRTFNPAAASWRGKIVLACRVGHGNASGIWVGYLNGDFSPQRGSFLEALPCDEGESYEDPRLLIHQGRLLLTCALVRPSPVSTERQAPAAFDEDATRRSDPMGKPNGIAATPERVRPRLRAPGGRSSSIG